MAEIFRSGIESVHQSQRNAGASLALSNADVMRYVVLPQAIRRVIPANMNMFIALQKDVALLSFIGPVEILRQAEDVLMADMPLLPLYYRSSPRLMASNVAGWYITPLNNMYFKSAYITE